jgi:hypothetical protein
MIDLGAFRRFGPARVGSRRFAAVASPQGIHAVEYVRNRSGIEVVSALRELVRGTELKEVAEHLADTVEAMGGRGGELAVALSGFGTAHHILALPPADEAVLRPVVERELLRYYPDLREPIIDFLPGADPEPAPEPKREVLVGAVPRAAAVSLHGALARRGIRLRHLTVLPAVLQSVWDALDGDDGPAVLLLILETGPLIGCFHLGALRLFIEPPPDVHGRPLRAHKALAEQVERAELFLRQQFANLPRPRVRVAAPEGELAETVAALGGALDLDVSALSDAAAGSVAALGVALGGESAVAGASTRPLELLPIHLRPRSESQTWTRRFAGAAAVVLAAAAVWWAGAVVVEARGRAEAAGAAESRIQTRLSWIGSTQELLEARQAHEHRLLFLDQTAESRFAVRRIMAAVSDASGPAIRVRRLTIEPDRDGWRVTLAGEALGAGSAAAVRAMDGLYRGIPQRLPVTGLDLGELGGVGDEVGGSVAIAFDMSFIVRWDSDLRR